MFQRSVTSLSLFCPEDGGSRFCVTLITICYSICHHTPEDSNVHNHWYECLILCIRAGSQLWYRTQQSMYESSGILCFICHFGTGKYVKKKCINCYKISVIFKWMDQIPYSCLIVIFVNGLKFCVCVKHIKSHADILIACDINVPASTL
jgi:hypothetical protein